MTSLIELRFITNISGFIAILICIFYNFINLTFSKKINYLRLTSDISRLKRHHISLMLAKIKNKPYEKITLILTLIIGFSIFSYSNDDNDKENQTSEFQGNWNGSKN